MRNRYKRILPLYRYVMGKPDDPPITNEQSVVDKSEYWKNRKMSDFEKNARTNLGMSSFIADYVYRYQKLHPDSDTRQLTSDLANEMLNTEIKQRPLSDNMYGAYLWNQNGHPEQTIYINKNIENPPAEVLAHEYRHMIDNKIRGVKAGGGYTDAMAPYNDKEREYLNNAYPDILSKDPYEAVTTNQEIRTKISKQNHGFTRQNLDDVIDNMSDEDLYNTIQVNGYGNWNMYNNPQRLKAVREALKNVAFNQRQIYPLNYNNNVQIV